MYFKNPFQISNMLSESRFGECSGLFLERKHIRRYVDEPKLSGVLPKRLEAGMGI